MSAPEDLIKELDVVALVDDVPTHDLVRGQVGTVVCVLALDVFEVEFVDEDGHTYAVASLNSSQLMRLRYHHAA